VAARPTIDPLAPFHPAVRDWFRAAFEAPTRPQSLGWPAIARGESTLILAPTGSGKTLTAFLWCLDRLMFTPPPAKAARCRVLYVSPLKALAVDVERNLRAPLAGIAQLAASRGDAYLTPAIAIRTQALRDAGLATAKPSNPATIAAALAHFDQPTLNLIASFQNAIVKNLVRSTFQAAEHFSARGIVVSGGVSANRDLRARMSDFAADRKLPIAFPAIALSTDNAAMIAAAAWPKWLARKFADDTLEPTPQLRLV